MIGVGPREIVASLDVDAKRYYILNNRGKAVSLYLTREEEESTASHRSRQTS